MTVDPETTEHQSDFDGRTYFFCSARCKSAFEAAPAQIRACASARACAGRRVEGDQVDLPDASGDRP